jgi:hypothetical protein
LLFLGSLNNAQFNQGLSELVGREYSLIFFFGQLAAKAAAQNE